MASQDTNIGLAKYLHGIELEAVVKANPTKEVFGRAAKIYGCEPKIYMSYPVHQASFAEELGKAGYVNNGVPMLNGAKALELYVRYCIVGVDEHIILVP